MNLFHDTEDEDFDTAFDPLILALGAHRAEFHSTSGDGYTGEGNGVRDVQC